MSATTPLRHRWACVSRNLRLLPLFSRGFRPSAWAGGLTKGTKRVSIAKGKCDASAVLLRCQKHLVRLGRRQQGVAESKRRSQHGRGVHCLASAVANGTPEPPAPPPPTAVSAPEPQDEGVSIGEVLSAYLADCDGRIKPKTLHGRASLRLTRPIPACHCALGDIPRSKRSDRRRRRDSKKRKPHPKPERHLAKPQC